MSKLIDALRDWGCDTGCIATRFIGKEDFYRNMLQIGVTDKHFEPLKQAVECGDVVAAFENAHAMKGTLGNLGITPAYNRVVDLVEPLRHEDATNMREHFEAFAESYEKFCAIVKENDE